MQTHIAARQLSTPCAFGPHAVSLIWTDLMQNMTSTCLCCGQTSTHQLPVNTTMVCLFCCVLLAGKLEEEVGCEDPWNGELLVRMIDMPFIDPGKDADDIASWRI